MAIKPVTIQPKTDSQRLYQRFWRAFNEYSAQNERFCAEFKPHPYAGIRYFQDYAVAVGPYHLCFCVYFNRQECKVEAYFRDLKAYDIYFNQYKESIESQIGHPLEWKKLETKAAGSLIRIINFDENNGWHEVFEQAIKDLLLLKKVFGQYCNQAVYKQSKFYSDLDYEAVENPDDLFEGAKKTMIVNRYERDPEARRRCIEAHGCKCSICGLDFGEKYGIVGEGFIHVHHIVPLSTIGKNYKVNPDKDLIPVCPNCHAMLHRLENGTTLSVEELRKRLGKTIEI